MDLFSKLTSSAAEKRLSKGNCFAYRTEVYLEQREKNSVKRSPPGTITTWKNLKHQKQSFDHDQAEIDRVLSTINSIHGAFNRSLNIPCHQIYSSLYGGGDDDSIHLMRTFCQRQDHYLNSHCLSKSAHDDESNTQEMSSSLGLFSDSDLDNDTDNDEKDEEKEEKQSEKKNSYDSAYGSMMPKRQYSRESFVKITQPWRNTSNAVI